MDVCLTCNSSYIMADGECKKKCTQFSDCVGLSWGDNQNICNTAKAGGVCEPCSSDSQCVANYPGFNYVCGGGSADSSWYKTCGECRNAWADDPMCGENKKCRQDNHNIYRCFECNENKDCNWRNDGKNICNYSPGVCQDTCVPDQVMSTTSCNKKASELKCPCSTRYYPKGSLFSDGYDVEGLCTLTRKGNYYCRNEEWERTGKYKADDPDATCYHKSTLVNVAGSGQKLISDLTSEDFLQVIDFNKGSWEVE